jgi:hypothetical protein
VGLGGGLLVGVVVVVVLVGVIMFGWGFCVGCVLGEVECELGVGVFGEEFGLMNVLRGGLCGEWNYTVCSNKK